MFTFLSIYCAGMSQRIITGKVIDAHTRQPLAYANVGQSNSDNVLTDEQGNFSYKLNSTNLPLLVSYIGYKSEEKDLSSSNEIKVELQPSSTNLKDVVLTNTSTAQRFSSIAKIDLDLKPVRNTQELLRVVPGLFIAQHAGGGKAEQIFLRGFDCDHGTDVEVSVDGLPVNMVSHAHGQGYADAHFIIPETVENVDYGTGPYYAGHGNLNTAGYVSLSTFKTISQSRVQVEAGRFSTHRALALLDLFKTNKDKQSAYIAGEYNYTNGPTISPQHFNRLNVFGKYNCALSSSLSLSVSASAFRSRWDASGQVPSRAVEQGLIDRFGSIDPTEGGSTERYNLNFSLSKTFRDGALLESRAYYSRNVFNLFSNFTFFLNDSINGDEIDQAEKRNLMGYTSRLLMKTYIGNVALNSTYGVGVRYDATNDSYLSHVVERSILGYVKKGDIREVNTYAYMQHRLSTGRWTWEAGMRLDNLNFQYKDKLQSFQLPAQNKSIISPKVSVQYSVDSHLQLYAKAGKGFHSNDTRVVTAAAGVQTLPAAYGADFGIILKPASNLYLNIAAWYLYLDQEFVYVGDDGNIEPSGKTSRRGIDIIARYQLTKDLFANANMNLTKPRAIGGKKGEDYIPLAPTATSTGGVFYKKKKGLNVGLSYRYIKSRPANEDNSITAKGYFVADATVNYTGRKYEAGIAVENLFNTKWNEAQFATTSRLKNEASPVTELNFTPGSPFFVRAKFAVFF